MSRGTGRVEPKQPVRTVRPVRAVRFVKFLDRIEHVPRISATQHAPENHWRARSPEATRGLERRRRRGSRIGRARRRRLPPERELTPPTKFARFHQSPAIVGTKRLLLRMPTPAV